MSPMPKQKRGASRQDYGTPPEFLRAVRGKLDIEEFDIDLAASDDNAVCPNYLTKEMDALSFVSWQFGGGWNWLNPPFANIEPWVRTAYDMYGRDGAQTAILIPASVGANWWRNWVHGHMGVYFINGRLTFNRETAPYPKDCALLLIGREYAGYHMWQWRKEGW